MKASTIYAAMYNSMIEESCFGILSLHKTHKGAETAVKVHKAQKHKEWEETEKQRKENIKDEKWSDEYKEHYLKSFKFGKFEAWNVFEMELEN